VTRRSLAGQRGQASIEFVGTIWLVVLAGLIAWQLALVGWTAVAASNAARTAARAYSKSGDAADAEADGAQSLSGDGFTSSVSSVTIDGETARVHIVVPILVPDVFKTGIPLNQSATMPNTG
jgi:uncharacterized protein (UPF0333 family)